MFSFKLKMLFLLVISTLGLCTETNILTEISPIEIKGKHFINSATGERFLLKGLAYQPGGSAEVTDDTDPLSNPEICARDIPVFQKLGVNTIRIYSVNPELNHDYCMSLLAMAGIYLVLDVNSPLSNQHLNRYEPWKSYNLFYLDHVFKVIKQFSSYPNTLAFFAGNEVVNDKRSSQFSPRYVKHLIGDLKQFSQKHCERNVPIGYSAADDLNYRVSLSHYLECLPTNSTDQVVDFYGVNSYQWCGDQTLQSSGYDILIDAYNNYTKPVILSEFGCNKVLPRKFGEVKGIFSSEMLKVFSGGLAYEYSQESNNYGIVEIQDEGDIWLLSDFHELQKQYSTVDGFSKQSVDNDQVQLQKYPSCQDEYENLNIKMNVNDTLAPQIIKKGVSITTGKYIKLTSEMYHSNRTIYGTGGIHPIDDIKLKTIHDLFPKSGSKKEKSKDDSSNKGKNKSKKNGSTRLQMEPLTCILLMLCPWLF